MLLPKVEIKKILYATDLSDSARYAFAYAVSMAEHYQASITLLHVLHDTPDFIEGIIGVEKWKEIKQRHYNDARDALIGKHRENILVKDVLGQFCDEVKTANSGTEVDTEEIVVREGNAVDEILNTAAEKKCDVIVMGTHGLGNLADAMMLGSTAKRVLRRSRIPVFVIRLPESD